jgi:hypothetical protein
MHKLTSRQTVLILGPCVLACLALSAGCASPATGKAMTASELRLPKHNPSTVFVHVAGGQETEAVINMPKISSDAFREALVATIEGSRLFARVLPQAPADYRLEISIVEAKQKGALTTDTTMTARWKLIRSSDGKGVFNEFIESSGESNFTIGPARIRHSLESAGRENIKLGLTKLSELDLQGQVTK